MIRFAYDAILKSQDSEVTRRIVEDGLHKICKDIEVALDKLHISSKDIEEQDGPNEINDSDPILNPPRVKPKGVSNARLKGHFEKRKTKPKIGTEPKVKKKASKDKNIMETSTDQQNVLFSANIASYPSFNPQRQFSSSTQIPYQVSPHIDASNLFGVSLPYWNAQVSSVPYGTNIMLHNAQQMEYMRTLQYNQQEIASAPHLRQDLFLQSQFDSSSNKER